MQLAKRVQRTLHLARTKVLPLGFLGCYRHGTLVVWLCRTEGGVEQGVTEDVVYGF
jgi:hypothetical protein